MVLVYFGDMEICIEKIKWFLVMVGNYVVDIVEKYGSDLGLVFKSFIDYIE